MSRKVILITYNGGPANFLPGVEKDRRTYLEYFKSRTGGAYTSNEIIEFQNDPMLTVTFFDTIIRGLINQQGITHLVIVFCGHGYEATNGNTFLVLSPQLTCSVQRISTLCTGAETLLITDCCRCIGPVAIKRFHIGNPLFNVAYATDHGQFALEDKKGGIYTRQLIKAGHCIQFPNPHKPYPISSVQRLASIWTLSATEETQHPQINGVQINNLIFSYY